MEFSKIEKKWQDRWEKEKAFTSSEDKNKEKFYVLEMYPYPSASFLHMGHVRNYTIGDVFARYKRMAGFNVLYPMGFDSFGLPAETAAKKEGVHPEEYTKKAIAKITEYLKALGNSYDWTKTLSSHDPEYYKWNQYFFLKMYEKGLAYRKKSPVNWCGKCESVLANEESEGGKCWRCGGEVTTKNLDQWFLKITDYADDLLEGLEEIEWPERIKTMQKNWIGKSRGYEINFEISGEKWPIFTTRPDTIYGVTFMVVSSEHERLMDLVTDKQKKEVSNFLKRLKEASEEDKDLLEKEGVFTGSYAINPSNNEKIPIWAGNFVLADYGSGMVMAVPAHDQRDFEFAKKYNIPINIVVKPDDLDLDPGKMSKAFTSSGKLINSGDANGMLSTDAISFLGEKLGIEKVNYRIRDWLISRQRYWGTPIPMIYCDKCGIIPVEEKDLPVLIPNDVTLKSSSNHLVSSDDFMKSTCPKCGGVARRESDTMGGFVDSSWYFLRYCDNKNKFKPFEKDKVDYWMPVDQYVGGAEHAVMHLIYARFFTRVLKDLGFISFVEPFKKLFNQGIVYKDGAKMSKSKGNVVFQTDISEKYGIDTARLFLMFVSSPDKQMEWSDKGVEGASRIIKKIILMKNYLTEKSNEKEEHYINTAIKSISNNIESFDYPKAVVEIVKLVDLFSESISKENYKKILKVFSPFCPHVAEELWENIGEKTFISLSEWPIVDEKKINEEIANADKLIDKTVSDILNILKIIEEKESRSAECVYIYAIPKDKKYFDEKELEKRTKKKVKIYAINDKEKYDPENKSSKAKLGKPAIFIE